MEGFTPAQAAAITGLPLAAVHKAIDSRIVRPHTKRGDANARRLLTKEQLIFLRLESQGLRLLPVATRREIANSIEASPGVDVMAIGDGSVLFVECRAARRRVESQLKQLARIEEMVISDPEIMRGTPVFKGTRIPVDLVADMLAQGATVGEILEGYPTLNRDKVAMAPLYVRAFPRRGRPGQRPWGAGKALRRKSLPLRSLPKTA